jgi:hypothetical protein
VGKFAEHHWGLPASAIKVHPAVPCSMKKSTYRRRRNTVSTWKKSVARMVLAWASKNARQDCPDRRGAGSMPSSFRICHTVDGLRQPRRPDLALEHGDLVAQDQDLGVLSAVRTGEQGEPAKHPQYHNIGES